MTDLKLNHKVQALERESSNLSSASASAASVVLQEWSQLPFWQQLDSSFIETGYRPASGSYRESFKSWRYVHNETVNIFSHLVGSVLFFVLSVFVLEELGPRYETASSADVAVFSVYLLGVAVCFAFSTIFHTVLNHSASALAWGLQLDFQGILLLMWGATIPIIYYAFTCTPHLRVIYWTIISCIATICSIFTFSPAFHTHSPLLRPLRAALFGGFALSAIVPIFHSIAIYGWKAQDQRISLWYIAGIMAFNTTGAVAYAFKFPERYFRRTFDILGASHQIMHIMVLCAAVVHVFGLIRDFDNAHGQLVGCPASTKWNSSLLHNQGDRMNPF